MCIINLCIPYLLQWFKQRAPRAFAHLLLFPCLNHMFKINICIPCVWHWFSPLRPSSVYAFIVVVKCLGNIFAVNVCSPCVWQWFSARAPRAFTHLLMCFLCLFFVLQSTYVFLLFCNDSSHAQRERSRIYCFSECSGQISIVNLCIPCVWQRFPPRAPRAFTHLWLFQMSG